MFRREARLRREYIYRKSCEEKQRAIEEKRKIVKKAIDENRKIPTHLRKDAIELQKSSQWGEQLSTVDDEYRKAGCADPKIVITTSREPSAKLKIFAKIKLKTDCFQEMRLMFPNAQAINRGHYDVRKLVQACRANDVTDFILVHETRGSPDGLIVCHLPFGPTAYFNLTNVVMRHDVSERKTISEVYPHLIFNNMNSRLGQRITSILKYLFPVPKPESRRIMTFSNEDGFISFRHHTYTRGQGGEIELTEVGPRFEIRPYCIKLGTLENIEAAETEWVLRPYMNTASKRQLLSVANEESD
ncbi:unnamed protein product [Toxocara canis]|uniref:Brix domain-containing protein n=1 Tax=Toxocara canis TaxID=6265 RepID=A0A183UJA1_TOXCA|nr:unnamed protein product [Toxocara canis]